MQNLHPRKSTETIAIAQKVRENTGSSFFARRGDTADDRPNVNNTVVGGWWLVVGGWWLVVSGWWLVVSG
jgi:hypothetical protein